MKEKQKILANIFCEVCDTRDWILDEFESMKTAALGSQPGGKPQWEAMFKARQKGSRVFTLLLAVSSLCVSLTGFISPSADFAFLAASLLKRKIAFLCDSVQW